jgi:drug/metabolite transporter (DMT)-like permease
MTPRVAILAILGAVTIFGSNFALSRRATLDGLTPSDLTALRFGTAGILLLPIFLRAGARNCAGVGWSRGLMLAFTSGAPMSLLMNTGVSLAPAAHGAAFAPGTGTIVGLACGFLLFRLKPSALAVLGTGIIVAGLACLAVAGSRGGSSPVILGDLLFIIAGGVWGIYPFLVQVWAVGPITSTAVISVLSLAFLPAYVLFLGPRLAQVSPAIVAFHAFNQGILNVIVALWLWASAVKSLGAATAQRFPPLIPVVGTLSAIPVLGEWPGPLQAAGLGLIVLGLAATAFGNRPRRSAAAPS